MAVITSQKLAEVRQYCDKNGVVNWTKPEINAALNAIDAWFDSAAVRTGISNAVNTATAPKVFTAAEKLLLLRAWLQAKFDVGVS